MISSPGTPHFKIWLAYVSYPVTTAVYLERALRKMATVYTIGPKVDEAMLQKWGIAETLKLPITNQNIPTSFEVDLKEILKKTPKDQHPDLFLWVESVPGFHPKNIDALPCPSACYMIDSHINWNWHPAWGRLFDYTFIAHREFTTAFQNAECRRVNWLPVACDPEIHRKYPVDKSYEVGFVGSPHFGFPRQRLLDEIAKHHPLHRERCFWTEMALVFSKSKLVFNRAVKADLNMRVFEALSTGSALLTDDPGKDCGLHDLFTDEEDLILYQDSNLLEKIEFYLKNEEAREKIARAGMEKVHRAHTYDHRAQALLQVVQGLTFSTPSASEWRSRSENNFTAPIEKKFLPYHFPTSLPPPTPHQAPAEVSNLKIWLAYVSYPITTAVYFERALRKLATVYTCGPTVDEGTLQDWGIQNELKLPIRDQDITVSFEPNMGKVLEQSPPGIGPDFYLWIESVSGYFPKNLAALPCPKACYLIDTHLHLEWHLLWATQFDYVFLAQREYVELFRSRGMSRTYWLPLACDPDIHQKFPSTKTHEVGFVGSPNPGLPRQQLLDEIAKRYPLHRERCFWTDMALVFSKSKLVFNRAVKNDLNMRVFEALSTGSALLTDDVGAACGLNELFTDGEDLILYNEANLFERIDYYLKNEEAREKIARSGMEKVHRAHTYAHRANALLNVVLGHTFSTPDAREWRAWSEEKPSPFFIPPKQKRSFVIPVLDHSPASCYSIQTLLKDLEAIEGEVLVVFNDPVIAKELADHPRITRSITVSQNIGVARAWNLGLHLSRTPVTFVCNADLHLLPKAVTLMEKFLLKLENAAVVGPMGAFFDFFSGTDYLVLQKGDVARPLQVDAVSGFLFAVKTELFQSGTLVFEDQYTPCYFEEWDLGIQCRRAGLTCWVVPTSDYDHHWSGTIRAHREVKFYDEQEAIESIHQRNQHRFWQKWIEIAKAGNAEKLLASRWPLYLEQLARDAQEPETAKAFRAQANAIIAKQQRDLFVSTQFKPQ